MQRLFSIPKLPEWVLILPCLIGIVALWSTQLNEPFIRRHENNTVYMTIAGQNYLKYGHLTYGLAPILNVDPSLEAPNNFYLNHPPLGPLLASFSLALVGAPEVASRIVPMFLTLLGISAFALWTRRTYGPSSAVIGVLFLVGLPMIAYYGQMLNHEPLVLAFALLLLPLLDDGQFRQSKLRLFLIGCLVVLMTLSGWQGLFFTAAYLIYAVFARAWRMALVLLVASVIGSLLWLVPLFVLFPSFAQQLQEQFLLRSGIREPLWNSFGQYIWEIMWARWRPRFTEAATLLTAAGMLLVLLTHVRGVRVHSRLLSLLLLVPGLLQVTIFQQQTFTHDYTLYYFAPFVALMSAVALHRLWQLASDEASVKRWVYGGLIGLLILGFALSSARWIYVLYTSVDEFPLHIASEVQKFTSMGEPIYSSGIGWSTATWFYSQREFRALSQAPAAGYVALMCSSESHQDRWQAGELYCKLERR